MRRPGLKDYLVKRASEVLKEAEWIGILNAEVSKEYFDMMTFSKTNYEMFISILRKQKQSLAREFDQCLGNGQIEIIKEQDKSRYQKLYKAKYLKEPKFV